MQVARAASIARRNTWMVQRYGTRFGIEFAVAFFWSRSDWACSEARFSDPV